MLGLVRLAKDRPNLYAKKKLEESLKNSTIEHIIGELLCLNIVSNLPYPNYFEYLLT
jgi:hypothetical protein